MRLLRIWQVYRSVVKQKVYVAGTGELINGSLPRID
jgi:hypothetical protein